MKYLVLVGLFLGLILDLKAQDQNDTLPEVSKKKVYTFLIDDNIDPIMNRLLRLAL